MSERTLSDEVQSVLLAHSFDAPDADDTIARTLAATVDQATLDQATLDQATLDQASLEKLTRRRWRPGAGLLSGAAVAVVVLAVGAGVVTLSRSNQDDAKSSATSNFQAGNAYGGSMRQPNAAQNGAGSSAGSATTRAPSAAGALGLPDDLDCPTSSGTTRVFTLSDPLTASVQVVAAQCSDATGERTGSEVYVAQRGTVGSARTGPVLIPRSADISVDTITSEASGITVRFLTLGTGSLQQQRFQSNDGGKTFHSVQLQTVASTCSASAVSASLVGDSTSSAAILRVRNVDGSACVIDGYPAVGGSTKTLRGAAGGTTAQLVPIVLLQPGETASASIEQPLHSVPCPSANPSIALPRGDTLTQVAGSISINCQPVVHPFVAGSTGSG